ncbi:MAG: 4-hydroxy-tetrahydrodipicolinate synthase [Saprospiraceae bacterium]|nr:4-hydroxy-tetrahydrodipicolinate synthase [Saprospiraceae bacterium]
MHSLNGLGVALVTPFEHGKVALDTLRKIIDHVLSGPVDFLVSLGTTGETSTLSMEEASAVVRTTVDHVAGRKPVVCGLFGGNNTMALVEEIGDFDLSGITALLSASPAYNKPPQEGIYQHYMRLAEASPLPIIIYNVPSRTSSNISAETTLRLAADSKTFIGIKEANTHLMQGMQILKHRPEGFKVWSGDDPTSLALIAAGGDGVISVIGNALPQAFGTMVKAALEDDFTRARHYNNLLLDLHKWIYVDGNPAGVKGALELLGIASREVRLPLVPLREKHLESLRQAMETAGLLPG